MWHFLTGLAALLIILSIVPLVVWGALALVAVCLAFVAALVVASIIWPKVGMTLGIIAGYMFLWWAYESVRDHWTFLYKQYKYNKSCSKR
jgi:hypothetical protein